MVQSDDVNEQTAYASTPCVSMTTSSSPRMVSEAPSFFEAAISLSISSRSSVMDRISVSLALLWRTGTHVHLDDLLVLNGYPGQQAQPVDRLEGAVPATVSLVEGETAETVEDRLVLVDLDGRDGVDAVSHDDVGAGIDRRMGDLLLVLQHLGPQAPVVRRDQDVDLRPERFELIEVFVQLGVVGHGQDDRWDAGAVRHPGLIRRMRRQGGHSR